MHCSRFFKRTMFICCHMLGNLSAREINTRVMKIMKKIENFIFPYFLRNSFQTPLEYLGCLFSPKTCSNIPKALREASWTPKGPLGTLRGGFGGLLGCSWGALGSSWAALGCLWECSGSHFGRLKKTNFLVRGGLRSENGDILENDILYITVATPPPPVIRKS